uniref:Protein FAM185A n=1 Tax=Scolopendra viridis TaxID=118503 RepID=A0A4D5R9K3_SCOVI
MFIKPSLLCCFSKNFKNFLVPVMLFRNKSDSSTFHQITVFSSEEKLSPTGSVNLHLPFNVQIQPVNVEDFPQMDKTFFKLVASCGHEMDEKALKQMFSWEIESTPFSVLIKSKLTDEGLNFCRGTSNPFMFMMNIPLYCNLQVETEKMGNVSVSELESKKLSVSTDKGGIHCKRLKCAEMNLKSNSGDVLCTGVLQGNINIKTKNKGSVTGMRFQGNEIDVATEDGSIDVSAIYADRSCFQSNTGNMNLENYHGNGAVSIKQGNLFVSGLDGSLKVEMEKGSANIQVSRFHSLHIMNKQGDVKVNVPETLQASLELEGKELQIEKRLRTQGAIKRKKDQKHLSGFLGAGKGPLMMLFAPNGEISLNIQDWLSSLQLGGVIPEFSHKRDTYEPQPLGK